MGIPIAIQGCKKSKNCHLSHMKYQHMFPRSIQMTTKRMKCMQSGRINSEAIFPPLISYIQLQMHGCKSSHIYIYIYILRFKASAIYIYIYIAAWQIMHGSEQFFEKNNSPIIIATHPDADADLQSQTVHLAIIYIKCIIQTAYKRHKKGIKGYSPELQREQMY